MIRLNVHQAKTHLSKCLNQLSAGETIVLCKRNTPVAEFEPFLNLDERNVPSAWQRTN